MRMQKVVAMQGYIEEFKQQQAEWRRLEREKLEEENRRLLEYASHQQRKEEDRMAKVQEREQAKESMHRMVREHHPTHTHTHSNHTHTYSNHTHTHTLQPDTLAGVCS